MSAYFTRESLAAECGISLRRVDWHLSNGTCRLDKAKERVPGVGVRINAQLAAKFIAMMKAKREVAV